KEQIYSNVLIGFDLFRNIMESIDDFSEFINDEVETFFLNLKEKRLLIKLIYSLKSYQDFLNRLEPHSKETLGDEYVMQIHSSNPGKKLVKVLLLKKIDSQKAVVISGGSFKKADINKLQRIYKLNDRETANFVNLIIDISS